MSMDLLAEIQKLGDSLTEDMKSIIKLNGAMATGALYNKLKAVAVESNTTYKIVISYPIQGKFIDEGRKPGSMPPLKDIENWTRIKGIPISAAFPIAMKIKERGYKGIDFTRAVYGSEAKNSIKKHLGTDFAKYITQEILENNKKL